jgi:polysaccharide export outer membrane protein
MGTKRLVLTGLLTLLVTAGGVRPVVAQQNPRIAPRDQVSVTVFGVQEFTKKYAVAADGTLEFPELGRLQVSGMTARELGDLIAKRLKEADIVLNPQVAVEVEQTPNKRITVNGSVRSQGVVEFAGEISLLEALVKAGGRMPEAADEVLIYRSAPMQTVPGGADNSRGPTTIEVNAQELENGVMSRNVMLQDGDVVLVRKAQAVTITGFVRSVGAYTVASGTTVEEALALAGGVSEKGSDRRIEITRKVDGKPTVLKGVKKTDIVKPGDIIKVGPRIM